MPQAERETPRFHQKPDSGEAVRAGDREKSLIKRTWIHLMTLKVNKWSIKATTAEFDTPLNTLYPRLKLIKVNVNERSRLVGLSGPQHRVCNQKCCSGTPLISLY